MYAKRLVHTGVLATVLVLALGGCRYYWFKPGTTTEAFGRDSEACLQEARSVSSVQKYGLVNEQIRHMYRSCLTAQGYERQKTTAGPDKYRGYEFDD